MNIMDAIKKGFEIAGKNLNIVLIIFVFLAIGNLVVIPFTPEAAGGADITMPPVLIAISAILFLVGIFVQGGILGSVTDVVKAGKPDLGKFKGYGMKFYPRLLGLLLVIMVILGLVGFLATFIVAASTATNNAALVILAVIVALVLVLAGLAALLFLFLSPYIAVIDDAGVPQAIKTSVNFVKKAPLKIIGLGLLLILIRAGIGLVIMMIAGMMNFVVKGKVLQAVTALMNAGAYGYISVVMAACLTAYYLASKGAGTKA